MILKICSLKYFEQCIKHFRNMISKLGQIFIKDRTTSLTLNSCLSLFHASLGAMEIF